MLHKIWADPAIHITPGEHGSQNGSGEPGASGVNTSLAAANWD